MSIPGAGASAASVQPAAILRVLAWPAASPGNRYLETLYAHLQNVRVDDFQPGWGWIPKALRRRYDIFHIHWLERAFWRTGRAAILRAVVVTLAVAAIVKARGGRLIWTAHDPVPHEMRGNALLHHGFLGMVWKCYSALLVAMVDGVILLSITHRDVLIANRHRLSHVPFAVIPHPHFKDVYPDKVTRSAARAHLKLSDDAVVLLLLGFLRPYKNAEGLIKSFSTVPGARLRLVIAGDTDDPDYAAQLEQIASVDDRILLHFGFVPDHEMQLFFNAADGVVIPFRKATNSGSVALALSFGKPVAIPDIPVFRELHDVVGKDWLFLFDGQIDSAKLEQIVRWLQDERTEEPPLEAYAWDTIAGRTTDFFQSVRSA